MQSATVGIISAHITQSNFIFRQQIFHSNKRLFIKWCWNECHDCWQENSFNLTWTERGQQNNKNAVVVSTREKLGKA